MTIDEAAGWHTAVRRALGTALDSVVQGPWVDDGGALRGPAHLSVSVAQRQAGRRRHGDIGFTVMSSA